MEHIRASIVLSSAANRAFQHFHIDIQTSNRPLPKSAMNIIPFSFDEFQLFNWLLVQHQLWITFRIFIFVSVHRQFPILLCFWTFSTASQLLQHRSFHLLGQHRICHKIFLTSENICSVIHTRILVRSLIDYINNDNLNRGRTPFVDLFLNFEFI